MSVFFRLSSVWILIAALNYNLENQKQDFKRESNATMIPYCYFIANNVVKTIV